MHSNFISRIWRAGTLLLALSMASAICTADEQNILKVMPLGDSLTAGYPLSPELSYRKKLRADLQADGKVIDYVGDLDQDLAHPLVDLAHQGMVGATIATITNRAAWNSYHPDLILLMAGTNDFRLANLAAGSLGPLALIASAGDLNTLIENINRDYQARGAKVDIFVSSIPPMGYATGNGSSTVLDTLPGLLTADGRSFGEVNDQADSVSKTAFVAAFSPFLTRRKLTPDLNAIFQAADANHDSVLFEHEYAAAIKLLGEFVLNKYITDYNNNVRQVASANANTHFVDAGAQLTLADFDDGTHPSSQQGYDKLEPAWFTALKAFFGTLPHYYVGSNGIWEDGNNWAATPNGPGGIGQPTDGSVYLLSDQSIDRSVLRDSAAAPGQFLDFRIDATGGGNMLLQSQADLKALLLAVGVTGLGQVQQTNDSTATIPNLIMGSEAGSAGTYVLAAQDTTLKSEVEEIGFSGSGDFAQDSGHNDVLRQLILGFSASGSGTYTLAGGTLSANEEFIGLHGSGTFIQTGGELRVEVKSVTAGNTGGTLTIAAEAGSHGLLQLQGGTLSAIYLFNNDGFFYTGGILTADQFVNNGGLRLRGVRQLNGNLFHTPSGQMVIPDAFSASSPTRLQVTGVAELQGTIQVILAPGVTPKLGDSTAILTAEQGISALLPGALRLPLLPGKLILRGDVIGNALVLVADQVNCDDVRLVRSQIGRRGTMLAGDVNNDGVVDVRDLAIIAQKLPVATSCPN